MCIALSLYSFDVCWLVSNSKCALSCNCIWYLFDLRSDFTYSMCRGISIGISLLCLTPFQPFLFYFAIYLMLLLFDGNFHIALILFRSNSFFSSFHKKWSKKQIMKRKQQQFNAAWEKSNYFALFRFCPALIWLLFFPQPIHFVLSIIFKQWFIYAYAYNNTKLYTFTWLLILWL